MHIRNRNDLIEWLENNAPFPAIARALQEGQVENLGAFEQISPSTNSIDRYWIAKVISVHKKIWYIKITPIPRLKFYGTIVTNNIPWEIWIGDTSNNKLYQGDNPLQYKELRDGAK